MRTRVAWLLVPAGLGIPSTTGIVAQGPQNPWPPSKHRVRTEWSVMVPMRDGIRLSTDLYFPVGAGEKLGTILIRTPYNKKPARHEANRSMPAHFFAGQGFAVAVQDVRGKFESEGEYLYAGNDGRDGYDATAWIAAQPWSNGKVGTYGCSYLGEVQYQQAKERSPYLAAMIPQAAGPVQYRAGGAIDGGAIELTAALGWFRNNGAKLYYGPPPGLSRAAWLEATRFYQPEPTLPPVDYPEIWNSLPLIDMLRKAGAPPTDFEDLVSRDFSDPWWDKTDFIRPSDRFDVPTLHVNSWYDFGVGETLELFNQMRVNAVSPRGGNHQFAIISPTTHCQSEWVANPTIVGTRNLGDARFDHFGVYLEWFRHWLMGADNGVTRMPKLQLFVLGKNEWRAESEWPLARTRFTRYYMRSDGRANSRYGTGALSPTAPGAEPPDRFVYDPATPVPTSGGTVCRACSGSAATVDGAVDQSAVEIRNDVLVYTTPPLVEGVEVTGPVEAVLYVSSSARDTDFTIKLVDVYPDGAAYNIQEGILRARYREGLERKVWLEPDRVYRIGIDLHATSNYFGPGHRIRVEVSSSNFPRFDRNLNTGGNNFDETAWVVARNAVHHSAKYPSHVLLPIIPERGEP